MTVRLSMSSLTGTSRTLVAVGTARLAAILVATRAAGPRSTVLLAAPSLFAPASLSRVPVLSGGAAPPWVGVFSRRVISGLGRSTVPSTGSVR